jgi:hypothetical protein
LAPGQGIDELNVLPRWCWYVLESIRDPVSDEADGSPPGPSQSQVPSTGKKSMGKNLLPLLFRYGIHILVRPSRVSFRKSGSRLLNLNMWFLELHLTSKLIFYY